MTRKIEVETLKMSPDSEKYFQYQEDVETLEYMYRTLDKLESRYRIFPSANKDVTLSEYLKKEEDLRRTIQKRVDVNRDAVREKIDKMRGDQEIISNLSKVSILDALLGKPDTPDKESILRGSGIWPPDIPGIQCLTVPGCVSDVDSFIEYKNEEVDNDKRAIGLERVAISNHLHDALDRPKIKFIDLAVGVFRGKVAGKLEVVDINDVGSKTTRRVHDIADNPGRDRPRRELTRNPGLLRALFDEVLVETETCRLTTSHQLIELPRFSRFAL